MRDRRRSRRSRLRIRAVLCALFYGLAPWWVYEKQRHYSCGYLAHAWLNLVTAYWWVRGPVPWGWIRFEIKINGPIR